MECSCESSFLSARDAINVGGLRFMTNCPSCCEQCRIVTTTLVRLSIGIAHAYLTSSAEKSGLFDSHRGFSPVIRVNQTPKRL